ncbi:hypothetical protein MMYC01_207141 [Madurella mycetomatis]|uniref:Uncharacterized protein n=1 Tax=Madurella mycetomatis TaxID=100816 RepID=A0A175VZU0_9PEZI|nr:hypothetical protein MMYC01_207141 [Madurella mycetomatis]
MAFIRHPVEAQAPYRAPAFMTNTNIRTNINAGYQLQPPRATEPYNHPAVGSSERPYTEPSRPQTPPLFQKQPSGGASYASIPSTTMKDAPVRRNRGEMVYDLFEAALLSISDSQLLLSIAQLINFANTGRCTTSRYHYNIGLHLIFILCWSSLIAMVLLRNFYKAPVTALVRVLCLFGLIIADSLILLPAACFLDRALYNETFLGLSQERMDAVGAVTAGASGETGYWIAILLFTAVSCVVAILQIHYNRRHKSNESDRVWPGRPVSRAGKIAVVLYWALPWLAAIITLATTISYVFGLKEWAVGSGWMRLENGRNEENEVRGMGQIAPMVAVGAVFLATFEKWVWPLPE